jgi:hypothetical protein
VCTHILELDANGDASGAWSHYKGTFSEFEEYKARMKKEAKQWAGVIDEDE